MSVVVNVQFLNPKKDSSRKVDEKKDGFYQTTLPLPKVDDRLSFLKSPSGTFPKVGPSVLLLPAPFSLLENYVFYVKVSRKYMYKGKLRVYWVFLILRTNYKCGENK